MSGDNQGIEQKQTSKLHPYFAMGISKKYTEPETFVPQAGTRTYTGSRGRRSNASPSRVVFDRAEQTTLPELLRQIWFRLHRTWIALRYQSHRFTFGMFQRNALIKAGFLAIAGYFLFFSNTIIETTPGPISEEQSVSTALEWSEKPVEAKSRPKAKKSNNEAAPVSKNELRSEEATDYVNRFKKVAIDEMNKYGVPASISLAQGLIESRAGTSKLAVNNNNHFGIKCFSRNCGKGHCTNFTDDTHKDFFRKFKSPWDSWHAHSQLLASGRYAKLKKHGRDYRKWAYGLKSVGYATDRTYAEKLIGIIERYDLYKYDR